MLDKYKQNNGLWEILGGAVVQQKKEKKYKDFPYSSDFSKIIWALMAGGVEIFFPKLDPVLIYYYYYYFIWEQKKKKGESKLEQERTLGL